ncbi:CDP-diacylglycerol--serine O-phosphatidyltransferase [Methanosarcina sp. MTP4]|jgi:archaetidylserine synthase|uniref:archaetidylserine synthase n=1 Tax=Methanosarcina sp. MTP4 TaxID=1434100 RepID=UPI000615E958|nr:archaetidylserine synthase [Methanosarcina sp. MTP4]AKB26623.1 CDP-diacylglycerol--serine O-phosphatidyltransferase [Methanosarcina sp. MTP4]
MTLLQLLKLPDFVSLSNLFFGISAISAAHVGSFDFALILLLLAAIADGADGYFARKFGGGKLGEQLDSLADAVSFGVAPALLIYFYFGGEDLIVVIFAYFYALCGVLRLARFNVIPSEKTGFEGLPITAGCVMLASYMLLGESLVRIDFLLALTLALSLLMVSSVAYPKIKNFKLLAFIAFMFFAMVLLFFIDLRYMRFFSPVPFILMLVYMLSPFLKVPMLSNVNNKRKR